MNSKANEISGGQVFIFVIGAQISFGILSLASSLSEKVGHDGWISVILAGFLTNILILIVNITMKRFNNLSILEINVIIFGRIIGNFLNLLVIGYLVYATTLAIRLFNDIIKISTLPLTPGVVLTYFIMLPTIYISWYGLKYICRYASLKLGLLIIVVAYYFLLSKYFRLTFLQPFGEAGLMKIIKASYTPYISFLGFELLTIIYPFISDKKKAVKFSIYANMFTMTFYVITVFFLTGFFGEEMLKHLIYPIFSLARAYRAPVLERLDLFFIALWFPIMGIAVKIYYFCGYHSIRKLLKLENNKKKSKRLLAVYTIFVITLSRWPKDMVSVSKLFDILGYIGTAYVIYIVICYLISFIKGGNKRNASL